MWTMFCAEPGNKAKALPAAQLSSVLQSQSCPKTLTQREIKKHVAELKLEEMLSRADMMDWDHFRLKQQIIKNDKRRYKVKQMGLSEFPFYDTLIITSPLSRVQKTTNG